MKMSSCVWVERPDGKIVVATRRGSSLVGLPGGKQDPGETAEQTARRELQEETGIVADELQPVFVDFCNSDDGSDTYLTTVCFMQVNEDFIIPGGIEPGISTSWEDPEILIVNSPFGEFNQKAIDAIMWYKTNKSE